MTAPLAVGRLGPLDYIALLVYFAINLGIGHWWSRRRQTTGDFFLGGGKISWWAAGISFFATGTSSITFMALPARSFSSNWQTFASGPAQTLAGFVLGIVFAGILRRLSITTIFEYLERRFSRSVRVLGAVLAVILKIFGRMSVVMLLPSLALSTVTGLNMYASILIMGAVTTAYAVEGGFAAVIWTDIMQVGIMTAGVTVALIYLGHGVPHGFGGIIQQATSHGKFDWWAGWASLREPSIFVFVGMFLGSIFTQLADQPLMQRVFSTPDVKSARATVLLGSAVGFPSTVIFYFVGTALAVFYQEHPDRLVRGLATDAIFPYFIVNELPHGVIGLIVAGLFAAAMGALSSALNSTAAILVKDFYIQWRPASDDRRRVAMARYLTIVAGAIATGMALYLASLGITSLWDQFLKLIALFGGGFPGVFGLGLLTRRASSKGVTIGACASIAITFWVQTYTDTNVYLHSFVAIASCMVIGYIASLCLPDRHPRPLAGLTVWDMS